MLAGLSCFATCTFCPEIVAVHKHCSPGMLHTVLGLQTTCVYLQLHLSFLADIFLTGQIKVFQTYQISVFIGIFYNFNSFVIKKN